MLEQVLSVGYLVVALLLIGFVLIQQGKGAGMGASFGAGGSNTVFGSSGSGNFMTKITAILATCFFVISLLLGTIAANKHENVDEFDNLEVPVVEEPVSTEIPTLATELPVASDLPAPVVNEEEVKEDDVPN
ncbi:preprotein translocase subunit SecG [Glaciecola sp. 33A]|jgi:preprotein translocase subunit SecG|uniref:preprotein translocase subunit SecG n=1 Tax=Glaciecola sp. 33A TaxID=2057807 RepID=UPI000C31FAF3|nr:preprotein translocase subunit SecG [Glaciecola sp. 33A]PKI00018.1 preprotein translocase subunit SecG [Glaciecola sp. 33A]